MYDVNCVMDEFSNEFLTLENFIEKYIPLKMQNQIAETLDNIFQVKEKKKLRKFEEKKFSELRSNIIADRGLPDLQRECRTIIHNASKIIPDF